MRALYVPLYVVSHNGGTRHVRMVLTFSDISPQDQCDRSLESDGSHVVDFDLRVSISIFIQAHLYTQLVNMFPRM